MKDLFHAIDACSSSLQDLKSEMKKSVEITSKICVLD
jgi:hypothetical protein